MLILGRKLNESIVFEGLDIEVIVTAIQRGRVRLGIKAPPGVTVLRHELLDRVDYSPPKEVANGSESDSGS